MHSMLAWMLETLSGKYVAVIQKFPNPVQYQGIIKTHCINVYHDTWKPEFKLVPVLGTGISQEEYEEVLRTFPKDKVKEIPY